MCLRNFGEILGTSCRFPRSQNIISLKPKYYPTMATHQPHIKKECCTFGGKIQEVIRLAKLLYDTFVYPSAARYIPKTIIAEHSNKPQLRNKQTSRQTTNQHNPNHISWLPVIFSETMSWKYTFVYTLQGPYGPLSPGQMRGLRIKWLIKWRRWKLKR